MRTRLLAVAAMAALVLILVSAASAQYESSDRSAVGIRMAVYRPTDSALTALGSTWLGPVIDYYPRFDKNDLPQIAVSLGWFSEEKQYNKASFTPITVSYVKRTRGEGSNWYYGGGLGAYFVKFQEPTFTGIVKDSGTLLGANLVVGREWGAWFADLRYDITGSLDTQHSGGVGFSGLTLSIGSHFAF